ncbi:uncharacterized protein BO66DRAFT_257535 [Aspergillus aculeatinus CBS 121060]|uniref:Uncharacterized protein n=1 Tax=Aspergillus aculeatinus CBS 121060 TaxID=1448322 RepID=A0ACD1GRT7_9EURO|nr:hypothetical protein BO66DRAFT_257535 [Aspergillus aculeatinus CBS 121060]RAH63900.1 hypothetical protein BO66DRAFT_257535 [Aspergillus aculeatinus CBS 121060]
MLCFGIWYQCHQLHGNHDQIHGGGRWEWTIQMIHNGVIRESGDDKREGERERESEAEDILPRFTALLMKWGVVHRLWRSLRLLIVSQSSQFYLAGNNNKSLSRSPGWLSPSTAHFRTTLFPWPYPGPSTASNSQFFPLLPSFFLLSLSLSSINPD